MSLSPENKALVERFYKDGAPESLELGDTPFYRLNACLNAARAEASPLSPVGWVMVPKEPTEAMIDAAEAALSEWRKTLSPDEAILRRSAPVQNGRQWMASATPREKAAIRYAAMIAAAPVSGASHG